MSRKTIVRAGALLLPLFVVAAAALADEHGIKPMRARKLAKAMDENKTTLAAAIAAAEASSKGKAVLAHCEMDKSALVYAVFCLAGDKLMDIDVDGKNMKIIESKEVKPRTDKAAGKEEEEEEEDVNVAAATKMVKSMDDAKITLTAAMATAEESCKGKAVLAKGEMEGGKLVLAVYCVAGERLLDIDVDALTNKVIQSKEVSKHEGKREGKSEEKEKKP